MSRSIVPSALLLAAASSLSLGAACSAKNNNFFTTATGAGTGNTGGTTATGSGAGTTGTGGQSSSASGINITVGSGSGTMSSGSGSTCNHPPDVDGDGDGWTANEGDCNDCDPNVNPGAVDVLHPVDGGMPTWGDEDCDGKVPDMMQPAPCDMALAIDDPDPMSAAKAVELCQTTTASPANKKDKIWGVINAKWVLPDGSDPSMMMIDPNGFPPATMQQALANYHLGHGLLSAFGANVHVQAGARMLGLSSGTARQPTDPGYQAVSGFNKMYTTGSPAGFPKESPACPGSITGTPHDGAAVELKIRTPTNATGFSFDFNFFTYEWPNWVCSTYNDFFVSLLNPIPMGQVDGNISFDKQGNPVSVNNAFVEVCACTNGPPCMAGGKSFTCALGNSGLMGTGFGSDGMFGQDHASTGWLVTKAPVKGGTDITIRWTVYDSGDGVLDTSTLIDNWQWVANGGTVTVGTDPINMPK